MLPGDLLPAGVGPWRVADRDLDDARTFSHQLADKLIVEFEPFRLNRCCCDHGSSKGLVTTFVVREILPIKQVCRKCDEDKLADRKSTRLNSSHLVISYAVFCLKKKK